MKIVVTGTRGFPNIQGGIETHCEGLYPRIAAIKGMEVTVTRRRRYLAATSESSWQGVRFKDISVPAINGVESAIHTFLSVFYAWSIKADVLHIHGVGPAIAVPLAKILGLKVVVTHQGPDYERAKWGPFAKFVIRTGERFAALYANDIIAVSSVIVQLLEKKYKRTKNVHLIYNGVNIPVPVTTTDYLDTLGIAPLKYILAVGRLVEEKNLDQLLDAFAASFAGLHLVIAGDSDIETAYSRRLKARAKTMNNVTLTGMIKGNKLAELYSHAALLVLPSSHEGLPLTLLEAMSYKRRVVVSDIPANLAVKLDADSYFKLNDPNDMKNKIQARLEKGPAEQTYDLSAYNWDAIAEKTARIYTDLFTRSK
ncbi:MAG: glycosyltransferase family 4 protein [Tannerellaceae bacterium]|jgi:glycosyltransferase involved in cell wall biosynthesis|nr:glycosyltransferase family 4 protein [Tannerellaceae bacterium]